MPTDKPTAARELAEAVRALIQGARRVSDIGYDQSSGILSDLVADAKAAQIALSRYDAAREVWEEASRMPYVLATKYHDGDPCDGFAVGFVVRVAAGRFIVADASGTVIGRANGFARAASITQEEGAALLAMFPAIADKPGPSLWERLDEVRAALRAALEGGDDADA